MENENAEHPCTISYVNQALEDGCSVNMTLRNGGRQPIDKPLARVGQLIRVDAANAKDDSVPLRNELLINPLEIVSVHITQVKKK